MACETNEERLLEKKRGHGRGGARREFDMEDTIGLL